MPKNIFAAKQVYIAAFLFIAGWWSFAFQRTVEAGSLEIQEMGENSSSARSHIPSQYNELMQVLSPLRREEIHAALNGNAALMAKLMAEWDIDAQIIESSGIPNIQRLPPYELAHAQRFARKAKEDPAGPVSAAQRFLPQTYVAASFLLALLPPEQIVAIPRGLRNLTHIYPKAITESVPLDTDRYNSEQIFQYRPSLAFVASYSHPATIQALKTQGIQLCYLKDVDDVPDVGQVLKQVGCLTNSKEKAEALHSFIQAILFTIDNRMQALRYYASGPSPSFLFVNFNTQFAAPTRKTLTGKLLQRLGVENALSVQYPETEDEWSVYLTQEQILHMDPDYVVVGITSPHAQEEFMKNTAFKKLSAVRKQQVYFVDAALHESPTQYIALAYFDLYNALAP